MCNPNSKKILKKLKYRNRRQYKITDIPVVFINSIRLKPYTVVTVSMLTVIEL